jgi:hypothetical protein
MYCREYRTQFYIGVSYGISESRVCEIIKEVENILIIFSFAGQKEFIKRREIRCNSQK